MDLNTKTLFILFNSIFSAAAELPHEKWRDSGSILEQKCKSYML